MASAISAFFSPSELLPRVMLFCSCITIFQSIRPIGNCVVFETYGTQPHGVVLYPERATQLNSPLDRCESSEYPFSCYVALTMSTHHRQSESVPSSRGETEIARQGCFTGLIWRLQPFSRRLPGSSCRNDFQNGE